MVGFEGTDFTIDLLFGVFPYGTGIDDCDISLTLFVCAGKTGFGKEACHNLFVTDIRLASIGSDIKITAFCKGF